jgi:4-oxalocrotonate tautomerase
MPFVEIKMWKGRGKEIKKKMIERVTEAITETISCPKEAVQVIVLEVEKDDWAIGGKICSERNPG